MTPEQKFKDWALDPNGGGWRQEPDGTNLRAESIWDNEQAAFLAGMEADRWISVDDRLPEHPNVYLVSDDQGNMDVACFTRGEFYPPEEWSESDIKFWQTLPKPPKP